MKTHVIPEFSALPMKEVEPDTKDIINAKAKLHCLLKSQIIKVVNNEPADFDKQLLKLLQDLYFKGYSKGLKHMNKMYRKA